MAQEETKIPRAIALSVTIIILSVISALIVGAILNSSVFNDIPSTGTNTNESLGAVTNVSNSTFDIISTQPSATCSLGTVYNGTGGEILTATNYTFYTNCKLILNDTSSYIGESLNVTYGFTYASGTSLAGVNVTAIADDFGEFITGLLGFLGIIGIVLGIIWLIMYVAKLFSKGGLNDLGQAA